MTTPKQRLIGLLQGTHAELRRNELELVEVLNAAANTPEAAANLEAELMRLQAEKETLQGRLRMFELAIETAEDIEDEALAAARAEQCAQAAAEAREAAAERITLANKLEALAAQWSATYLRLQSADVRVHVSAHKTLRGSRPHFSGRAEQPRFQALAAVLEANQQSVSPIDELRRAAEFLDEALSEALQRAEASA